MKSSTKSGCRVSRELGAIHFTGTVQAIDDAGHLEQSMTLGLWSRSGTSLKVYGFDDDDLARILHISTVDLGTKVFNAEVWELD